MTITWPASTAMTLFNDEILTYRISYLSRLATSWYFTKEPLSTEYVTLQGDALIISRFNRHETNKSIFQCRHWRYHEMCGNIGLTDRLPLSWRRKRRHIIENIEQSSSLLIDFDNAAAAIDDLYLARDDVIKIWSVAISIVAHTTWKCFVLYRCDNRRK